MTHFLQDDIDAFHKNGFIAVPQMLQTETISQMVALTHQFIAEETPPLEYEATLGYPGAPTSLESQGGHTIRRLQLATSRHPIFLQWATNQNVLGRLRQLLGPDLVLPMAHHNCIMTKHPRFSSDTGWHQDIRYWNFQKPELVSVLLALTPAAEENGCLRFLPGTHTIDFRPDQLDKHKFLRTDLPQNKAFLNDEIAIEMQPGDAIFFHCKVFHAASRNRSDQIRKSVIFTYHSTNNPPIAGTRSTSLPEILIPNEEQNERQHL